MSLPGSCLYGQKVGLVLSGGGAKGLAHIGVLKAFEENGIPIDYVAGTSMGGVVGGFYAAGYSPSEIEYIAASADFQNWINGRFESDYRNFFKKNPDAPSFLTAKVLIDSAFRARLRTTIATDIPMNFALLELLGQPTANAGFDFDSLFVPFRCMVADIFSQNAIVLRDGSLSDALRGTVSVPFFYRPIQIDGKYVFDGGLYNNFPVDVMREEFDADVIVGSNTSSKVYNEYPEEIDEQLLSKITVFLFLSKSDSTQLGENGVFINPDLSEFSATDFEPVEAYIKAGYEAALQQMPRIKQLISRRVSRDTLQAKRARFNSRFPPIRFSDISIKGATVEQRRYIERIFRQNKSALSLKDIKNGYYRLVADDNFETVYPRMIYDSLDHTYRFELQVTPERNFLFNFGGNVSTRPISNAFMGVQYNILRSNSYTFGASFYSGRFYESARLAARMDIPWRVPFFLQLDFIYNHWNYFRSSEIFIEDLTPTYIDQNDKKLEFILGLPGRNNGRYEFAASAIRLNNKYYLDDEVTSGPLDLSVFDGYKFRASFERNTLDRKQYPSSGHRFQLGFYAFTGKEGFIPIQGTALPGQQKNWLKAKLSYERYFRTSGFSKLGYLVEGVWTNQPSFGNQKSSMLMAPVFYPLADSKSLYLESLRARKYAALGLRNIITFYENIDLRMEGYIFKQPDLELSNFSLAASAALVYHSPVGPVGLNVSYYDDPERKLGVLFHIGYLIYNKRANE
ncbi:patatin [Anseongella ginsenosidimutans]|nr:patatin [Anseongella ginsenosidimutans]